mmetsp:Transcript_82236/g.133473  ORF Transcript_82236/g.133473 Transcript_82236/m.133473 type:complete len:80 (-) Transcript_82236:2606-2845(-)
MAIHPERMYPERMYMLHRKDKNRHNQAHSYAQAGAVCIAANVCAGVAQRASSASCLTIAAVHQAQAGRMFQGCNVVYRI